jgi:hypothetical protein
MSQKKSIDYPFLIVLLFVISIGGYWIVQEIRSQNLNPYLDYLESRLLAVIPQNEDKDKVQSLYDEFKVNVEENKIAPEDVEQVAAEILNLSKDQDSITVTMAEDLLASVIPPQPAEGLPEFEQRERPAERKKWLELNEKMQNIYEFEETLKEEKLVDKFRYQFGDGLQIIADSNGMRELINTQANELILTFENLEKENILIWTEDLEQKIQAGLDSAVIVIEMMQDSIRSARIKAETKRVIEMQRKDSLINRRIRESRRQRAEVGN